MQLSSDDQIAYEQDELVEGRVIRLLQFSDIPGAEIRHQLKDEGVELLDYYHKNTYLVALPVDTDIRSLKRMGVNAIDRLPWQAKVSRDILNGDIGDWALKGNLVAVVIQYSELVNEKTITAELANDCRINEIFSDYSIVHAQTDINNLYELSKHPYVQFLSLMPEPGEPEDTEGRSLHRSNMINSDAASGLKYDGTGVNVLTRDDGVVGPHIDYKGRLDNLQTAGLVNIEHADMVSGIFVGGGNLNPRAKGMASGAFLYVVNYVDHFMDNTLDLHRQEDVMVTNSSYSNGCNDGYTTITRTVDDQIERNPSLLHVFSAGNSGTRDCGYGAGNRWGNITGGHKIGKNVIATANLRIDVSLENSSSRGPSADGRIKPDLAARGTDQLSTDPNNLYSPGGGTSAASPGVAGVSAQLYHAYRDMNGGENPESALIKAALMNTANDLGNEGPDYLYGWGHINANRAYELLRDGRYERSTVDHQEEAIHEIEIPDSVKELRVMLYWKEPPAAAGSQIALINDLDLMLIDEDGNEFEPWLLDPTPDPVGLGEPAGKGRDSLNNVEQVLLRNPEPGIYKVIVIGNNMPFGERPYYVLYEMITEEISITYPYGGEGFAPSSVEQIHWDATPGNESFELEYSTDNGMTWNPMGVASASLRTYSWTVPNEVSSNCKVRVSRGSTSAVNEDNFSIIGTPTGLRVNRVCPEFVQLSWGEVEGATSYDIYMLGDTKMEWIGSSDTTVAEVPVTDVLADMWFAVRALGDEGLRSSRSIAHQFNEGILDCIVNTDVEIVTLFSPNEQLVYSCGEFNERIVLQLRNNGLTQVDDISINYQLDSGPVSGESIKVDLAPGESKLVMTTDSFSIPFAGLHDVRVWIEAADDELPGNDVISRTIEVFPLVSSSGLDYAEDFQSGNFPPPGYDVQSETDGAFWGEWNAVGADGQPTKCAGIHNEISREIFYSDYLYTEAIDLTDATRPILFFDYAYHVDANSQYIGRLRVVVYSFCGDRKVVQLINRNGDQLRTSPLQAMAPWTPASANDWRTIGFNLEDFKGSEVVIAFELENGFNTNLYLDNIRVEESNIEFPNADFTYTNDTPCALFENVVFEATTANPDYDYFWVFGEKVNPKYVSGPGPHNVRFLATEEFNVQLEVVHSETGAYDQSEKLITTYSRPTPNFAYNVDMRTVEFDNRSSRSTSYLWDFGDGNTSTEENPIHTYDQNGVYTVSLSAISPCTTRIKEVEIMIGSVQSEDIDHNALVIFPNPADNELWIEGGVVETADFSIELINSQGMLMTVAPIEEGSGLKLDVAGLLPGIYFISIETNGERIYKKLVIQ
ncbi:MAG: S8 family serine peptidase [Saprospiraceae bacterium]|nr:S8 family serine peptidase [Saprospiraceae bacterium]